MQKKQNHLQKKDLQYDVGIGDEGGYAPNLSSNREAFDFIVSAIKKAGYKPGEDIFIAIDAAASEFYNKDTKMYTVDKKEIHRNWHRNLRTCNIIK